MGIPNGWELVLIVLVIVLLFGYKKLPDATRAVGRSLRIFKAETRGVREEDLNKQPEVIEPARPVTTDNGVAPSPAPDSAAVTEPRTGSEPR